MGRSPPLAWAGLAVLLTITHCGVVHSANHVRRAAKPPSMEAMLSEANALQLAAGEHHARLGRAPRHAFAMSTMPIPTPPFHHHRILSKWVD